LDEHPELGVKASQFSFTSPKGRTDTLEAGVSTKRLLKNETQPSAELRKRMKGSSEMKTPGHGQPPRPQHLSGKEPHAKSKDLSALKLNAVRQDKPRFEKLHGSKGAPRPMAVTKEKSEAERGPR
jgi:hypothetical protein